MSFQLPKWSVLTDEQRNIIQVPSNNNIIVRGAPGTGKTVVALYRAKDMCDKGVKRILILVYNRPLMKYLEHAVDSLKLNAEINTYHTWLSEFYKKNIIGNIPKKSQERYDYDYERIIKDFSKLTSQYDHIILDEAQDFPLHLIHALKIISKNISCFMDINQKLEKLNTDYSGVAEILGIRTAYNLYENFRNTKEIYEFAKLYHTGEEITNSPQKLDKHKTKPFMIKVNNRKDIDNLVKILQEKDTGYSTIGILVNNQDLKRVYEDLIQKYDDKQVCMYKTMSKDKDFKNISFDHDGVFIFSFGTMKGLEFDMVIIPEFDNIKKDDKSYAYVALTRGRERDVCCYETKQVSSWRLDTFSVIKGNENLLEWE